MDVHQQELEGPYSVINLKEDSKNAVECMLQYMYLGDYCDTDDNGLEALAASSEGPSPVSSRISTPSTDQANIIGCVKSSNIASDALDETAKAPMPINVSALTKNVLVYQVAHKYDIPLLKSLAQTKFQLRAADEWAPEDIISILPKVYASTSESDRALRQIMLDVCLRSTEHLMCHKGFRTMLKAHASMCFDILDAVQMRSEEREDDDAALKAKQAKLKRVIEWTKTQERVFKDIIARSSCGSCARPLDLSVSNGATTDWHGPLIVKCRHCRIKYAEE
ncbi:MAG: hypothetical protein LQ337_002763 [Flavoplaca oasis]|nr:MAG: hypothetical protein LQ337_002763 [Flavoplaca oasis]